jgi:legumain
MFQDLKPDINIYATTASNAAESSWGTYCGADAMVDGKNINSCLGDLYSVNWMEDSDVSMGKNWTLAEQFNKVVKLTDKSHVIEFGTKTMKTEFIDAFQGDYNSAGRGAAMVEEGTFKPKAAISMKSPDAEIASAYTRFMEGSEAAGLELVAGVQARIAAKKTFQKITATVMAGSNAILAQPARVDMQCHKTAYLAYKAQCGDFTSQTMPFSATLAALCAHTSGDARPIAAAITEACA